MIGDREARAQALRLSVLDGFDEREEEIRLTLQHNTNSLAHAADLVSVWLKKHPHGLAPRASEIATLAIEIDPEQSRRKLRCAACDNTGFMTVTELHTWREDGRVDVQRLTSEQCQRLSDDVSNIIGDQVVVTMLARCDRCELGRRRAAEERRDQEEARAKAAEKAAKQRKKIAAANPHWTEREED